MHPATVRQSRCTEPTFRRRAGALVVIPLAAALALVGAAGCATAPELTREQALAQVDAVGDLDARVVRARESGLEALAPGGFAAASEALERAVAAARSGEITKAQELASEGQERLDRAEADSQRASQALREVLERRKRAIAADAPTLLSDRYQALERQLTEAARMVERGDVEAAKDAGPRLVEGYSSLELEALKTDAAELARKAIDAAREAGAKDHAPQTFENAQKELKIATRILETDRTRTSQANVHARRAAEFAARSQHVAELVKELDRMDYDREEVVLWYQGQVQEILAPLGAAPSFTQPNHEMVADSRARIAALQDEQAETAARLAEAQARIMGLEVAATESTAELQARLARLEQQQREAEARYARVDAMFNADEAAVYRRGQDVLLETYGFDFPVGQSEIQATNFKLLNKIARAISEFDSPRVIVTGHTDSTGNDELNQQLSDDRARKVGDFLVEVGQLPADRVLTEGFGESRPVASNETEEGRARNRRIEILIVNEPGESASRALEAVSAPPPAR